MSNSAITKKAISESFKKLCHEKPYNKISISDITDGCGLNRQSFYYHFQDIIDVLEWCTDQIIDAVIAMPLDNVDPDKAVRGLVNAVIDRHEDISRLLRSGRREQIERVMFGGIRRILEHSYISKIPGGFSAAYDDTVVLDFYTHGIIGVLLQHCGKRSVNVERLSKQLLQLFEMLNKLQ